MKCKKGHSILECHCIIHQQALCAKSGLTSLDNVITLVTKIVDLISSQALNKRKFDALLDEVNSVYNGLIMYNNVRWLSRGNVLQRFVDFLEEIRLFLQNESKIEQYRQKNGTLTQKGSPSLGYVNKQNCHIWSEANPQVYVETPLHPEKLTVWCALWAGGIIGPYFLKNDAGYNVTVNGDRYRGMITNFFIPELNNHDVQELWFQQDGAICHTARATIDLLKDTFSDRLISRFGPVNCSPRCCDLTRLDYFLWGYVKSLVYADKPQTLDHLEDNIRRVIADKRPQMLEKVIENWTSRLDYIQASRDSPMPEIIFKM
ncbi:putative transposable element [Trichonephila clavipes]|nr:putative transposable element [Trichonephila clavipes]